MVQLKDVARVTTANMPSAGDVAQHAWLVWTSVTNEAKRRKIPERDGYVFYEGPLLTHIKRLWPTLTDPRLNEMSRLIYGYLRQIGAAVCVRRRNPPTWKVAVEWPGTCNVNLTVYRPFRLTSYEQRLTPEEAGELVEPSPVTVRQKETSSEMTNDTINAMIKVRQENRVQRREDIAEFLKTMVAEPVTVDEIAHYFGIHTSTARSDLQYLVENGRAYFRAETAEERGIRYGGTGMARPSMLYWSKSTVPPRSSREVIPGFTVSPSERRVQITNSNEINRRLWNKLKRKGPRSRFSAIGIAEAAGLHQESVRARFRVMVDKKAIMQAGRDSQNRVTFKVRDLDALREVLGQPETDIFADEPTPQPVASTADVTTIPTAELEELLSLLDAKQKRIEELEEQLAKPATTPVTSISDRLAPYRRS